MSPSSTHDDAQPDSTENDVTSSASASQSSSANGADPESESISSSEVGASDTASVRDQDGRSAGWDVEPLDIVLATLKKKRTIGICVFALLVLGLAYALLAEEQYTTHTQVVREAQSDMPSLGGLGALGSLQGLGINLGGAGAGLSTAAFPNVLHSEEVRLAVVRDTFRFPEAEQPMTYVDYVSTRGGWTTLLLDYTLYLPWTIKRAVTPDSDFGAGAGSVMLTKAEHDALKAITESVSTNIDDESGLMTITVTASGPVLSARINQRFVYHLTRRVRELRTQKAREQLAFVRNQFEEAEQELVAAENDLAQFLERNQNPTTAPLQFEEDRRRQQVRFKEQLYSELQQQLTAARLDLRRQQPVVTVVQEASPPRERSAPRRSFIVILSVVLGFILGVLVAAGSVLLNRLDVSQSEKLMALRRELQPDQWWPFSAQNP